MFVKLGAKSGEGLDDPFEFLLACHARMRHFTALARNLASAGAEVSPADIVETAAAIARFFEVAAPLHMADEEESLHPLVRRYLPEPGVDAALRDVEAQHIPIEATVRDLTRLCVAMRDVPAAFGNLRADLASRATELQGLWDLHLPLEEAQLFAPLRAVLPEADRAQLLEAMRVRRAAD